MSVFYGSYGMTKGYVTPALNAKHIRKFDQEVWEPAGMSSDMRCLEIGCGTGHFLLYLAHKRVSTFLGIDQDDELSTVMPPSVKDCFQCIDVFELIKNSENSDAYDRILMFDVFEHFTPEAGRDLLIALSNLLSEDGVIVLKMPNAGSPWGLQFQHGDLTHVAQYTPDSIRQMAHASGYECQSCYPHRLGSRQRQRLDRLMQWGLNKLVATPPEIWEGNFYAILKKNPGSRVTP